MRFLKGHRGEENGLSEISTSQAMARLSKLIAVGLGAVGAGAGLLYSSRSNEQTRVLAAQKFDGQVGYSKKTWQEGPQNVFPNSSPGSKWDYNWDR